MQDVKFRADEDEYIKDEVRRSKIRICKDISFDQDQELSSQDWSSEEDLEKSSLLSKIKKKEGKVTVKIKEKKGRKMSSRTDSGSRWVRKKKRHLHP